jgi:hypothetical protein
VTDESETVGSPTEALRWLAKAKDDLAVANIVFDAPTGVNWAACFHAQQATEKALKAVLVAYGIDFPPKPRVWNGSSRSCLRDRQALSISKQSPN